MLNDINTFSLMLAQNGPPPPPGDRSSIPAADGSTGATGLPADGARSGSGGFDFLMIVFLMIGVMIIFSIMGTRRERKKREAMISSIKKHDKVQTIGGVIGSIVELKPDFVVLKVDESSNTRITFARSAIQQIIKSSTVTATENDE